MKKRVKFFEINKDSFLKKNKAIKRSYWLMWGLAGASYLVVGLGWNFLPKEVPLLYSLPWGEARLVKKFWIVLLPSLSLMFSGLNLFLSSRWFKEEEFLKELLAKSSLVVAGFLSFSLLNIMLVVI